MIIIISPLVIIAGLVILAVMIGGAITSAALVGIAAIFAGAAVLTVGIIATAAARQRRWTRSALPGWTYSAEPVSSGEPYQTMPKRPSQRHELEPARSEFHYNFDLTPDELTKLHELAKITREHWGEAK